MNSLNMSFAQTERVHWPEEAGSRSEAVPSLEVVSRVIFPLGIIFLITLFVTRLGFRLAQYPFLDERALRWLSNGLRDLNHLPRNIEAKPGLMLPGVLARFFLSVGIEEWLPFFGLLLHAISGGLTYYLLRGIVSPAVQRLTVLFFLTSFFLAAHSEPIDVQSIGILFSTGILLSFIRFGLTGKWRWLVGTACIFSLGLQIYPPLIFVLPWMVLTVVLGRFGLFSERAWDEDTDATGRFEIISSCFALGLLSLALAYYRFGTLLLFGWPQGGISSNSFGNNLIAGIQLYGSLFGWPLLLLAIVGAVVGPKAEFSRRLAVSLVLLSVGFLAVFDSALAGQLAIFSAIPVYLFAARGVALFWGALSSALGARAGASISCLVLFFVWYAISMSYISGYLERISEGASRVDSAAIGSPIFSSLYFGLYDSIRNRLSPELGARTAIVLADDGQIRSSTEEDRDFLYLRHEIQNVHSAADLMTRASETDLVLVAKKSEAKTLSKELLGLEGVNDPMVREGEYVAFRVPKGSIRKIGSVQPAFVDSVKADEYPERLFDGLVHDPQDWAASAHGSPIEVMFKAPQRLARIVVHLYDFDQRFYFFKVEYLSEDKSSWRLLADYNTAEPRGAVVLKPPAQPIMGLRLVSTYNSNERQNENNRAIHVTELELQ